MMGVPDRCALVRATFPKPLAFCLNPSLSKPRSRGARGSRFRFTSSAQRFMASCVQFNSAGCPNCICKRKRCRAQRAEGLAPVKPSTPKSMLQSIAFSRWPKRICCANAASDHALNTRILSIATRPRSFRSDPGGSGSARPPPARQASRAGTAPDPAGPARSARSTNRTPWAPASPPTGALCPR